MEFELSLSIIVLLCILVALIVNQFNKNRYDKRQREINNLIGCCIYTLNQVDILNYRNVTNLNTILKRYLLLNQKSDLDLLNYVLECLSKDLKTDFKQNYQFSNNSRAIHKLF